MDIAKTLLNAQRDVIRTIANRSDASECFTAFCLALQKALPTPGSRVILSLIKDDHISKAVAPDLDSEFLDALIGMEMTENHSSSCGRAHVSHRQVISENLDDDSIWTPEIRTFLNQYDIAACWSTPIDSSTANVFGSIAVTFDKPTAPTDADLHTIDQFIDLALLTLETTLSTGRELSLRNDLISANEKLRAFLNVMPDLAFVLDENGTYVDIYGTYESGLYKSSEQLLGRNLTNLLPEDVSDSIMEVIHKTLETDAPQITEYELEVQSGPCIFEGRTSILKNYNPDHPEERYVLWIARDISSRKNAERQIEQLAFYDPLTELPNRRLLLDRLQQFIEQSQREHKIGALLYLDLDSFKRINDSLGHHVGDDLLRAVSERLDSEIRKVDTLARLGGDEFVVLLGTLDTDRDQVANEARRVSQKIIQCLTRPFTLKNAEYTIGGSVGICLLEGNDIVANEALHRADTAMYDAKAKGGNQLSFFDPQLQIINARRVRVESNIIASFRKREFTTYFQPQLSSSDKVYGAEALLRWINSQNGLVSPAEFVPIAERCGVLDELQEMVFSDACSVINELRTQKLLDSGFRLSVNISAAQIKSSSFRQNLLELLRAHEVSPRYFTLEIKEEVLLADQKVILEEMDLLSDLGFSFAVDDFGREHSSITSLSRFPIDLLKINKNFIHDLNAPSCDTKVIDAITALSSHLDFEVIADGVEYNHQANLLAKCNVQAMQGYHYARPMDTVNFVTWVGKHREKQRTMSVR